MKAYLLIIFVLFMNALQAQETPQQKQLLDKLSDEACVEVEKIELKDGMTKNDISLKLGLAVVPILEKYQVEIQQQFHLDVSAKGDARTMGEKLGSVMIFRCEAMIKITGMLMEDKEFRQSVSEKMDAKEKGLEATGRVSKTEITDFYYVYFETDSGDLLKLAVLFPVNNETQQLSEVLKGKVKKRIKIGYSVAVVYSAKESSFKTVKIIQSVNDL